MSTTPGSGEFQPTPTPEAAQTETPVMPAIRPAPEQAAPQTTPVETPETLAELAGIPEAGITEPEPEPAIEQHAEQTTEQPVKKLDAREVFQIPELQLDTTNVTLIEALQKLYQGIELSDTEKQILSTLKAITKPHEPKDPLDNVANFDYSVRLALFNRQLRRNSTYSPDSALPRYMQSFPQDILASVINYGGNAHSRDDMIQTTLDALILAGEYDKAAQVYAHTRFFGQSKNPFGYSSLPDYPERYAGIEPVVTNLFDVAMQDKPAAALAITELVLDPNDMLNLELASDLPYGDYPAKRAEWMARKDAAQALVPQETPQPEPKTEPEPQLPAQPQRKGFFARFGRK